MILKKRFFGLLVVLALCLMLVPVACEDGAEEEGVDNPFGMGDDDSSADDDASDDDSTPDDDTPADDDDTPSDDDDIVDDDDSTPDDDDDDVTPDDDDDVTPDDDDDDVTPNDDDDVSPVNILFLYEDLDTTALANTRNALLATGESWHEWDYNTSGAPAANDLAPYLIIVWMVDSVTDMTDTNCQTIVNWLESGGKAMFAAGKDIMWDLQLDPFSTGEYNLYLKFNTTYLGDYAGTAITTINGDPGDPIMSSFASPNGLTLSQNGFSNGDYADELAAGATVGGWYIGAGTEDGHGHAAMTYYHNSGQDYKIAWLGVNFHNGLTNSLHRRTLLSNIVDWFLL